MVVYSYCAIGCIVISLYTLISHILHWLAAAEAYPPVILNIAMENCPNEFDDLPEMTIFPCQTPGGIAVDFRGSLLG